MRYSRFKSAMLGLEPQKRAKNGITKPRAKAKKETRAKQEEIVKSEHQDTKLSLGVKREVSPQIHRMVKQEQRPVFQAQFTPVSMTDSPTDLGNRLMTPCSDEALGGSPGLLMTPATDFLGGAQTLDMDHCTHEHVGQDGWADPPLFSDFDAAYDMEAYGAGMCEHQMGHVHEYVLQGHEGMKHHDHAHEFSDGLLEAASSSTNVKTEPWDSRLV